MHYLRDIEIKIKTNIKQYDDSEKYQNWKSRAKETHQLNYDRPYLRQPGMGVNHQPSVSLLSLVYSVWGPTYRRAIEDVSKAVNLDWINNQACRLCRFWKSRFKLGPTKSVSGVSGSVCWWSVCIGNVWQ